MTEKRLRCCLLLCLITITAPLSGAFEVLTPQDQTMTTATTISVIVQTDTGILQIKFNDKKPKRITSTTDQKNIIHHRLTLKPGKNTLNLKNKNETRLITIYRIDSFHKYSKKNVRMLHFHASRQSTTCKQCHDMKPSAADGSISSDKNCLACHPDMTSAPYVHGPVGAGACTVCHKVSILNEKQKKTGDVEKNCAGCHNTIIKTTSLRFQHGPFALNDCTICHNPHGSPYKFQLRLKQPDICLTCHKNIRSLLSQKDRHIHKIIPQKGCIVCHSPHASNTKFLLKNNINDLCLSCHDKQIYADRKHPVLKHPLKNVPDPAHPGKTMSCISCHQPHAGPTTSLLNAGSALSLCRKCHPY